MKQDRPVTTILRRAVLRLLALASLAVVPNASATHYAGSQYSYAVRVEISIPDNGLPVLVARGVNEAGDRLWAVGQVRSSGRNAETGEFEIEVRLRGHLDPHEDEGEGTVRAFTEPVPREGLIILPVGGIRREGNIMFARGTLILLP